MCADNKHYMRGEASFSRGGPSSFYGGIYKKDIGGGYNILRVYGVQLQRTTAEQSISFSDMSAHLDNNFSIEMALLLLLAQDGF